jgi:hypothetical protein
MSHTTARHPVWRRCTLWFSGLEEAVAEGRRSLSTARLYRDRLDNQVLPALGQLGSKR